MSMLAKRLWIWMDVSDACNLACRDCYTKEAHGADRVTPDRFKAVLLKLAHPDIKIEKLHLNWRGEPLTNKNLPELLHIRRDLLPDAPLELHTNGTLLTDSLSRDLIKYCRPADLLYVSVDGGNAEAHEANRGRDTWVPTLRGVRRLLDARDQLSEDTPSVGIYEIFYGRNRYDPALLALARRCDSWTRVDPIGLDGREDSFGAEEVPAGPCFWAGNSFCITASGDVHVCLRSFRADGVLGNLFTHDLATLVARAEAFRERLEKEGRLAVAHCATCRKTEGAVDDP